MKRTLSEEEYLGEEFKLLKVTPYITHLKQPDDCYYRVVTVASSCYVPYHTLERVLAVVFSSVERADITGSGIGRYIVKMFAEDFRCGVALCHHLDQFNRKRGRIISEGRLLKLVRRVG